MTPCRLCRRPMDRLDSGVVERDPTGVRVVIDRVFECGPCNVLERHREERRLSVEPCAKRYVNKISRLGHTGHHDGR